jgi:hypothetical protein
MIKSIKKTFRKALKRENLTKLLIILSTLALIATSILPYII